MCRLPAEVSEVLDRLLPAIRGVLGEQVVSIVLWGSVQLGDYRPGHSDIDLVVGLARDPDDATLALLRPVHEQLESALPAWRDRIEVAYVGLASLQCFRTRPHVIARISPGERLNLRTADDEWLIDWFQARTGVALFGPEPAEIMPEVTVDELRAEARRQLRGQIRHVPTEVSASGLAHIVLRACRALHAIDRGCQASKSGAGKWLAKAHPEWAPIAHAALRVHETGADDGVGRADVERFVAWAASVAGAMG